MLEKKINLRAGKVGSALIMTVVLTVLLSIVAVMFVMVARMDSASTSNIVDSKTLDNAAKSLVEIIGKELFLDTPGVAGQEYQDYPDPCDAWLANIEPYKNSADYHWRQISDVTGYLKSRNFETQNIFADPPVGKTIKDDTEIGVTDDQLEDTGNQANADADGDGIADSKWIEVLDMHTSKGKKVYAAVRVIDNCAMINVNTAYKFDANSSGQFKIDGTSQLQVNLNGLLKKGDKIDNFHKARCGNDAVAAADDSNGWNNYDEYVIWNYNTPKQSYLPFDISDELELRYRYCIDSMFQSRIERDANSLAKTVDAYGDPGWLYDTYGSNLDLDDWQTRIIDTNDTGDGDRRHLLTTYSFDRLIAPDGEKMWNVRKAHSDPCDAQLLYERLVGKDVGVIERLGSVSDDDMHYYLAQIAANIVDYGDTDSNVSVVNFKGKLYGYEPPFMFISEVARFFKTDLMGVVHCSYAIELYKNFSKDKNQTFNSGDWYLVVNGTNYNISSEDFNDQGGQYYVITFEDPCAPFGTIDYTDSPADGAENVGRNITLDWPGYRIVDANGNYNYASSYKIYMGASRAFVESRPAGAFVETANTYYKPDLSVFSNDIPIYWCVDAFDNGVRVKSGNIWKFTIGTPVPRNESIGADFDLGPGTEIWLERKVDNNPDIMVDFIVMPTTFPDFADKTLLGYKSYQRDMWWDVYLKGLWGFDVSRPNEHTLGHRNTWSYSGVSKIPPWHNRFTTAGDAAMVFRKSTYPMGASILRIRDVYTGMDTGVTESDVRFDVNCPSMQNVFKYITALPPGNVYMDANEMRVRGRININTAPAFVIAQLPWVSSKITGTNLKIADAIVAYRDMTKVVSDTSIDYADRQGTTGLPSAKYKVRTDPGFSSIGELMNVVNTNNSKKAYDIRYCGIDNRPQCGFPDLYYNKWEGTDSTDDDLEEKELIFARISDLATVRSDTFTAYILVRVGVNGPQKRFIAILDRSEVPLDHKGRLNNKVSVVAFQQVPAAR